MMTKDVVLEAGLTNRIADDVDWRGIVYDADKTEQTMRAFWRTWSEYVQNAAPTRRRSRHER